MKLSNKEWIMQSKHYLHLKTPLTHHLTKTGCLDLAREGKIKHTENYVKKLTEKTAEKIYREFERKQLDEANSQLADILIKKFSELMESLEAINDSDEMGKELAGNDLLRRDLKNIVGYITPYIPMIGLLSGGATVGKHVFEKKIND